MTAIFITVAILGLAFLMVVHEGGHFLAARFFGMRVTKFSIGFGPAIFRRQPQGSATTYQVAIIPFLAYVQIAGMNPFDEIDPNDRESYANAHLPARITTIFAGPLANYLVASVLFFAAFWIGGMLELTTSVQVVPGTPAATSGMKDGDTIREIRGEKVTDWEQIPQLVAGRVGQPTEVVVERGGERVPLTVVPDAASQGGKARLGVKSVLRSVPMSAGSAAIAAVEAPAMTVVNLVLAISEWILQRRAPDLADLSGPVGIVNETAKAARQGFSPFMRFLGMLSAYLAGFNLLPFPALDGGRLMFLGMEAVTRRRPNARIEAHIHAVGLMLLLTLVAFVTIFVDIRRP